LNRRLIVLIGLLIVLLSAVIVSRLRPRPELLPTVPERGAEALDQIYGGRDASDSADSQPAEARTTARPDTISGRAVLPSGEPAVGALVTLAGPGEVEPVHVTADSGGMFEAIVGPGQVYAIEASLHGFGPAILVGVSAGKAGITLALTSGRAVQGTVQRGGSPVAGATVHLGGPGVFPQRTVSADATGRFTVSGLRPGTYEYFVTASGAGTGFGGRLAVDDPGDVPSLNIELLEAPTLRVDVVDATSGEPVPLAVLSVAERSMHVVAASAQIDGGRYDIDYLPRGDYVVRVRAPGYMPYEAALRVPAADGDVPVRLSRGGEVRGRVSDPAGNPVPGAAVSVVIEATSGARWEIERAMFDDFHRLVRPDGVAFWMPTAGFATDAQGQFIVQGLPAGVARVVARSPGAAPAVSNPFEVALDQVYEPVNLTLGTARRVRGRVEDAGGGAVGGAFVSARDARLPAWSESVTVTSSPSGGFDIGDLGPDVVLTVRHPDFAPTEVPLALPPEGLDGVIVRLAGHLHTVLSGRLFTSRGAPAVGGLVWLMNGASALPACQATVGADGWFRATNCSAPPERLVASYPDHAPLLAEIGGDLEPRDWQLALGGELEVLSQRAPVVVSVQPAFLLPAAHWPPRELSMQRWSRERLRFLAPGVYNVRCATDGFDTGAVEATVIAGQRVEATCPNVARMVELPLVVVDPQGAPVPDAIVWVDRTDPPVRALSDARGRVTVRTRPGAWLDAEAMHEAWGRGFLRFYAYYEPQGEPDRVVLNEPVGGTNPDAMLDMLAEWGVVAAADGRAIVIDRARDRTPAAGVGFRRLDRLLWARETSPQRLNVGVRRDGDLLTFDLTREP